MRVSSWVVDEANKAMQWRDREVEPGDDEIIIRVVGCGVCHTDLSYYYEGVPTRHGFPLTLGHEVSGEVVEAGASVRDWIGKKVVVPAVLPCGDCAACKDGQGSICGKQIFPGNDVHGGFGTHLCIRAEGVCELPDLDDPKVNPAGVSLASLSVLADATSTAYQSVQRSGLREGDLAIVVGAGGVGNFAVQFAAATRATVVAIDISENRLEDAKRLGAHHVFDPTKYEGRKLAKAVRGLGREQGVPSWRCIVFECSGTAAGQKSAFSLMGHGGYLSLVGYSADKVELHLSRIMALSATVQGNWGCLPEHYPKIVEMVLAGQIEVESLIETRPMDSIAETFTQLKAHAIAKRVVLTP
jgi:6-hydroxycyclohex-1-ene-1-carbonyl-CoA dehydrogenase